MQEAKLSFADLDAVAVTAGPGLVGGLIVGLMTAKAIASAAKIPLIGVNHLQGHALSVRLEAEVDFPFLLLLMSGGHCQILIVEGVLKYTLLGSTLDDALGEAFDKTAKMLKLAYPGGPKIEQYALLGDERRFDFPQALKGNGLCNFSFSGLKTSISRTIAKLDALTEQNIADVSASFQYTVAEILADRLTNAIKIYKNNFPQAQNIVIAGGVAANKYLRVKLDKLACNYGLNLIAPSFKLCTDNAAMIAWAGVEMFNSGTRDDLSLEPKVKWPLVNLGM
jgi:N6-L-threonylcarbamoyladenine synthase